MKKTLISLVIVSVMLGIMAVPVTAVEQEFEASVTVNEVIDVTISDAGDNGIQFGPVDAGVTDQPDIDQSTTDDSVPAVTITINPATNVLCGMYMSGADFHATIPITGASWTVGHYNGTKFAMSTSDQIFDSNRGAGWVCKIWHFLSVPSGAAGGTHASAFTYTVVAYP